MKTIKDYFGQDITVTSEEQSAVWAAQEEAHQIERDAYPEDGSQDHIDHHIYGDQRSCVSAIEQELGEKYNTTFLFW